MKRFDTPANCIVDVDIECVDEQIKKCIPFETPKEVVNLIGEFMVPYNIEASAPELIGADPAQCSVLEWILREEKWVQNEVEECLAKVLSLVWDEKSGKMRGIIADYFTRSGKRLSISLFRDQIDYDVRKAVYLVENFRLSKRELTVFLENAFEEKEVELVRAILGRNFEISPAFLKQVGMFCCSNADCCCSDVEIIDAVLFGRAWTRDELMEIFQFGVNYENLTLAEFMLENRLCDISSLDFEELEQRAGRELFD
jgi:hypothetical protein